MYRVIVSKRASSTLKRIPRKYQSQIVLSLQELGEFPKIGKSLERELAGRLSVRIGQFRVVYSISECDKKVVVLRIDHRSNVYNA